MPAKHLNSAKKSKNDEFYMNMPEGIMNMPQGTGHKKSNIKYEFQRLCRS